MLVNPDGLKPIYVQISEWIENEILDDSFQSDDKVYSQYQLAELFNINPATAAKGLNVLADELILYKKRGLGMFVESKAKEKILTKRKDQTLKRLVEDIVMEAHTLHISEDELILMIKRAYKGDGR